MIVSGISTLPAALWRPTVAFDNPALSRPAYCLLVSPMVEVMPYVVRVSLSRKRVQWMVTCSLRYIDEETIEGLFRSKCRRSAASYWLKEATSIFLQQSFLGPSPTVAEIKKGSSCAMSLARGILLLTCNARDRKTEKWLCAKTLLRSRPS